MQLEGEVGGGAGIVAGLAVGIVGGRQPKSGESVRRIRIHEVGQEVRVGMGQRLAQSRDAQRDIDRDVATLWIESCPAGSA